MGKNKALFWFLHRSHGWWYTADDYCNTKDDNRDSWLQLTSTIWCPATFLGCLDSLSLPNIGDGDGGVQPWQCWDFYHHLYRCHWGESLSDRISTLSLFFCTEKNLFLRWWWWWSSSTFGSALCPSTRAWKRSRTLGLTRCQCQKKGDCHCNIDYLHTSYLSILVHHRIISSCKSTPKSTQICYKIAKLAKKAKI